MPPLTEVTVEHIVLALIQLVSAVTIAAIYAHGKRNGGNGKGTG